MASSQSSLSLAPRVGLAVVPNAYSPARPLTLHFSAGVFPSSLAAVFCLLSYKPNRSTALGCPYSDHFYHNLYVLNYKNDLCSFCWQCRKKRIKKKKSLVTTQCRDSHYSHLDLFSSDFYTYIWVPMWILIGVYTHTLYMNTIFTIIELFLYHLENFQFYSLNVCESFPIHEVPEYIIFNCSIVFWQMDLSSFIHSSHCGGGFSVFPVFLRTKAVLNALVFVNITLYAYLNL